MKSFRLPRISSLTRAQSSAYWLLLTIGVGLVVTFGAWWFQPQHIPTNFHGLFHVVDFVLFVLLSYVIWHQIVMDILTWAISAKIKPNRHPRPQAGLRVAFITTFVPGKEPLDMLERTLQAMLEADYLHDTWVLDEGNDPHAKALCENLGVRHFSRHGRSRYNTIEGQFAAKTKGGNHNAWYDTFGHQYDFVAQIDTDFIAKKNFLTRTLGYFRDPAIAFVGTPQVYGNLGDSIVAKGSAQQTYSFYGPIMRGFSGHSSTLLIGANHIVRVSAMDSIGYYRAHLTEDLLTGMTLHSRRWKSAYVAEILAVGEEPVTWDAYFNQQMRWAFGCIDILFRESGRLLRHMDRSQALHYFILQQHYFNGLALAMANVLLTFYFLFGVSASAMTLLPLASIYVPLILCQLLMSTWLQRLNVEPKTERGLLLSGKFVNIAAWPIYFLAFVGVLRGKRISFKVTPKGLQKPYKTPLANFIPHLAFGSITALDILISFASHHQAPIMIFWAALNSVLMFSVVVNAMTPRVLAYLSQLASSRVLHPLKAARS